MFRPGFLARAPATAALAIGAAGCGEEAVVRTVTRVEPGGGVTRRCEILGRKGFAAAASSLADFYGDDDAARFRFEARLEAGSFP